MAKAPEILVTIAYCAALLALRARAAPANSKTEIKLDKLGDQQSSMLMSISKCDVEDSLLPGPNGRSKRYDFFGSTWDQEMVTYGIASYSIRLEPAAVDEVMRRAFAIWEKHANLRFTVTSGEKADIRIRFVTGYHGDHKPFDGRASPRQHGPNKLAHAFAPGNVDLLGDIHFDDDEPWTIGDYGYGGVDLLQIAVHEIGHALGLKHSRVRGAIMNEWYKEHFTPEELGEDDIKGIQMLYGTKSEDQHPDICDDSKVDTIFSSSDGNVYVFKGEHYWRLTENGIAAGYPKLITTKWSKLPSDIDAALTYDGLTHFFKGSGFWTYDGDHIVNYDLPNIQKAFGGIPDDVDTAMVWNGDGKIYFFKGKKYWRVNPADIQKDNLPYRKAISDWKGLPNDLDAAFNMDGVTYFAKGDDLFRFDEDKFSVNSGSPYQLRSKLFGCPSKSGHTSSSSWWDVIFS